MHGSSLFGFDFERDTDITLSYLIWYGNLRASMDCPTLGFEYMDGGAKAIIGYKVVV